MDENIWISSTNSVLYKPFILMLRPLQLFGMYPMNHFSIRFYYVHAFIFYVILNVITPISVIVYVTTSPGLSFKEVLDALMMFSEVGITILKYLPIKLYPEKIRNTVEWLQNDLFNTYHKDQEGIAIKISEMCRKIYIYFVATCIVTLSLWGFRPLLVGSRTLPSEGSLPFDPYQNDYVFAFTYTHIFLGTTNAAFGNSSLDCLVVGLILQATAQIKIIKGSLKDVIKHADDYVSKYKGHLNQRDMDVLKNRFIYEEICSCVDRYNLVKQFVLDIEDAYSFSLFSQFTASVFVICLGCIQFFFVELWTVDFFTIVSFVITMSWEVFLYCYCGSLLNDESGSLVCDLYITDWLNLDFKCQKAYITVMENSKRPLIIRAGKIIDLSLETFATIMRRSYSLLAVLNNVIEN